MEAKQPVYEVTAEGRVFSISTNWRGYGKRELAQDLDAHGYPSVRIIMDGKRKRVPVHRLVAKQFLGARPSESHEVCHINGNKLDNRAINLRWGTRKENAADREQHGRTSRGARHSSAIKASAQMLNVKRGAEHYMARRKTAAAAVGSGV